MKQKHFTLLLLIFILLVVALADSGHLPHFIRQIYDFPYGDKLGHFLLMGLLSLMMNRVALAARPNKKPATVILTVSLILAFFVTLEELSQQFFPSRTFSLLDLASSYAGIAVFAWASGHKQAKKTT